MIDVRRRGFLFGALATTLVVPMAKTFFLSPPGGWTAGWLTPQSGSYLFLDSNPLSSNGWHHILMTGKNLWVDDVLVDPANIKPIVERTVGFTDLDVWDGCEGHTSSYWVKLDEPPVKE